MLAARSTATLGMKRFAESGLKLAACSALPIDPLVTGTWYQRKAAWLAELPWTVCEFQSDSTPPRLVYWFWTISRTPSASRSLPFLDGTALGGLAHVVAVVESVGPLKVELAVFDQSTWK